MKSTGRVWSSAQFVSSSLNTSILGYSRLLKATLLAFPFLPTSHLAFSLPGLTLSWLSCLSPLLLLQCDPQLCLIYGLMMKVAGGGMVVACFLLLWWRRSDYLSKPNPASVYFLSCLWFPPPLKSPASLCFYRINDLQNTWHERSSVYSMSEMLKLQAAVTPTLTDSEKSDMTAE